MAQNRSESKVQHHLKGMASHILEEVIQADMSMHIAQAEAWQWFAKHRPKGELINDDIHEGFARNLYLALSDLKLSFFVKPLTLTLWTRLKLAWNIIRGKNPNILSGPVIYDICAEKDENAIAVNITVTRFKNGTIKAEYTPVDNMTATLMN